MSEYPLVKVNLGELSKPATVLIEKISDAVGGIFKPHQIIRVAQAESEAERIRAESQIQVTDLHRRALHRFLEEEAKKQSNIESITQCALSILDDNSSPEKVEDDWITNFFDKCRIVSDKDMQQLWSRILAGEANSPGTFSKKSVNLLGDLDKSDAELFKRLCGFGWTIGSVAPLIFDFENEMYNREGIHFGSVSHLENLGLVQFTNLSSYHRIELPKRIQVDYFGRFLELTLPNDADNVLDIGNVLLTRAGQELARVCGAKPVEEFFDFVYERWAAMWFVPKQETGQGTPSDG